MKKVLTKTLAVIILGASFASCGKVETIQSQPTEEKQTTPTAFLASTTPPTITAIIVPSETSYPTVPAQATIEAYDSLCLGAKEILEAEISPNGEWIAASCYWENGKEESPLQVVSLDHSKEWKIYYRDYIVGNNEYGRKNIIVPYHWSKDEKFLYAVSPTIASGCCWIGGKYILLVRLNLETGEHIEMINGTDFGSDLPFSFTISEDDRFLLFTPLTTQSYDFTVLDLRSGETRVVSLEEPKPINLEFAIMSPYEDIIVLPLFKNIEYNDYVVGSLALIDLSLNEQRILVSGLKEGEELYPIHWIDTEHVLISNANPFADRYFNDPPIEYWSLNINTGERNMIDKP